VNLIWTEGKRMDKLDKTFVFPVFSDLNFLLLLSLIKLFSGLNKRFLSAPATLDFSGFFFAGLAF